MCGLIRAHYSHVTSLAEGDLPLDLPLAADKDSRQFLTGLNAVIF